MREGKPTPFDVPLNKLVPAVVGNPGVVISARAEVHDIFDFLCVPLSYPQRASDEAVGLRWCALTFRRSVSETPCQ
jgi:hypothetical protein